VRTTLVACAFLLGCGRFGFDLVSDARVDGDGGPDAPDAATVCEGPLGAPMLVPNVSAAGNDWGGYLSDDRLELFFGSDRVAGSNTDIFVATRTRADVPFDAPVAIAVLATGNNDDNPYLEAGELTMWFDTGNNLARTSRPSRAAAWSPPMLVAEVNSANADVSPALSPDGLILYFASTRPGGPGGYDLWVATRPSTTEPFASPSVLGVPNTAQFECCPHVTADGKNLLFSTGQFTGGVTIGTIPLDVTTGLPAGVATPVTGIDVGGVDELDAFVTRDDRVFGFASNTGAGGIDLYIRERACP
jgi:hypothetical protein